MAAVTPVLPSFGRLQELTQLVQSAEGFSAVVEALKANRSGAVDGTWGSSAALVTAALADHAPRTLLVVIAHPRDLDSWVEDLAGFAGRRPVVFPAWDTLPADGASLDTARQGLAGARAARARPHPMVRVARAD